jgi:hypothetical protein
LGVLGKLGQKPLFARTLVSPLVTTGDQEKPQFTPVMCPLCARSVPEMTLGNLVGLPSATDNQSAFSPTRIAEL